MNLNNLYRISPIILPLLIFLSSCSPDEERSYEDIDVTTGVYFYNEVNSSIGVWNHPNERTTSYGVYPNPTSDIVQIQGQNIAKIWLVPAQCLSNGIDISTRALSEELRFSENEIESKMIYSNINPQPNGNAIIAINLTNYNSGFYRVFIKSTSNDIYWKNIYYSKVALTWSNLFETVDNACNN